MRTHFRAIPVLDRNGATGEAVKKDGKDFAVIDTGERLTRVPEDR